MNSRPLGRVGEGLSSFSLVEDRVGASIVYVPCLFLIVSVYRVVDGVVQATALFALDGHTRDEVTRVDHIA